MLARRCTACTFHLYRPLRHYRPGSAFYAAKPIPITITPAAPRGSLHHDDLPSFLKHAAATGLSETSTVYIGTHYEYTSIRALQRLGFTLTRTGRSADLGIDIVGEWRVPSSPGPLRTIMQCKARSRKLAPESVRELEGAFAGAPPGWRADGVVGFLVAAKAATKGVRDALVRSRLPLGFVQVARTGEVRQLLWNRVAGDAGLEGMGVTLRHGLPKSEGEDGGSAGGVSDGVEPDVVLTYGGKALTLVGTAAQKPPTRRGRGRPRKIDAKAGDTS